MAFLLRRWVRHTEAFNSGQFTTTISPDVTPVLTNGPALFSYANSADTIAVIGGANYFAEVVRDLCVNDWIFATGSDASAFYQVLTVDYDLATITIGSAFPSGVIGTANIQDGAVTTPKILDANVTLAKLAAGIAPSHVIKFGGQLTSVGGAAAEAFTVTGAAAATDRAFVQVVNDGPNNVTVLQAVVTANTLTITFSADPGAGTLVNYQLIRAAA